RMKREGGNDHALEQGNAAERMQHLGMSRTHAGSFARCQDDYLETHRARFRIALPSTASECAMYSVGFGDYSRGPAFPMKPVAILRNIARQPQQSGLNPVPIGQSVRRIAAIESPGGIPRRLPAGGFYRYNGGNAGWINGWSCRAAS